MKKLTLLFTAILTALLLASPVYAADIRLSSRCTLADAIIAANRDRAEGDCPAGRGADTIILTRDITLDGGLPKITSAITIEGNGYTISGDNRYRMFYNDGGALTIKDLTMTKGRVEGDFIRNKDGTIKVTAAQPIGGAIINLGELNITNSSFSHNSADKLGGAIYNLKGKLNITNSSFTGNKAEWSGGAIINGGELGITNSTFSDNKADFGGAILNEGELSISDSAFQNNSADERGGGGAIDNRGELSINDSAFSDNSADKGGGGAIINARELSISNSTFRNNSADLAGAIGNDGELSVDNSSFSYNSADKLGGAIGNDGELSIGNSSFNGNKAEWSGGAILNGRELSISDSAFQNNSADKRGGAIANGRNEERNIAGELSISGSAFSGNSADESGGAIDNLGELSISGSTFSDNSAEHGGAIANSEYGELSIVNSIIAGGENACYSDSRLRHNISNFIQDGSCSPAFRGDPMLGALVVPEDGTPAYFPLLAGSRAIDAADDDYCPATDQIGAARPQGAGCDIGAIEYAAP